MFRYLFRNLARDLIVFLAMVTLTAPALAADPRVELKTSMGTIVLELYPDKAPKTVANFLQYVKDGHYQGTQFHRVIDGFMIQGGGFDTKFKEKPTRGTIENEAANGLKNDYGTIAMARRPDPHSASAQYGPSSIGRQPPTSCGRSLNTTLHSRATILGSVDGPVVRLARQRRPPGLSTRCASSTTVRMSAGDRRSST